MRKIFLPILALTLGSVLIATGKDTPQKSHDMAFQRNLSLFNALATQLERNYVDSIRTDEAFKAAIQAMLNTVDPYTVFYDTDEKESLDRMTHGSYGGIGAFVLERNNDTYISEPIANSPAHIAGVKAGDRIVAVDSVKTHGLPVNKVTSMLKGQPGTSFRLTVARPFVEDSILTFNITREKVQEKSVPAYRVIGNTGYVALNSFIDKSPGEISEALQSFKENPEVKNIVLDLRGNGGGLVESAVEILGNFLPKGTEVLRTRGKEKGSEKIYKTTHKPIFPDIHMAVLIDGGSASASEITAGALQDLDRAVLIGSNSYGKGLVQGSFPLPYDAILKVTIAKYYTPSGRLIQALDYSHRNPDGTVARTPDSLTHVFHTLHGREVRDGGGLLPDSVIVWHRTSPLLYELVTKHRIYDYANRYAATHPSIGDPMTFKISDDEYSEFINTLDTVGIKTDLAGSETIERLRTIAKEEGYLSPKLESHLDSLIPLFNPGLRTNLETHRKEIKDFISAEIASRYNLAEGRLLNSLPDDEALNTAIVILNDPKLYNRFLKPAKK